MYHHGGPHGTTVKSPWNFQTKAAILDFHVNHLKYDVAGGTLVTLDIEVQAAENLELWLWCCLPKIDDNYLPETRTFTFNLVDRQL